jgi:hypothetical protein
LRRTCGKDYIDEGRYIYTIVIKKKWFEIAHHGHLRENFIEGEEFQFSAYGGQVRRTTKEKWQGEKAVFCLQF